VEEYKIMRNMGNSKKTITATPRQLESMIRISEAIAKMRLATEVERKDVEEAVRLIKHAMQQSATDPTTGEIDMGLLTTGFTASSQVRVSALCEYIKSIEVSLILLNIFLGRVQGKSRQKRTKVSQLVRLH
jgi:DNA replication licensing factor MCM4